MTVGISSYYTCQQSSGGGGFALPFDCNRLRFYLDSSGPLFVNLEATSSSTDRGAFRMTSEDSPLDIAQGWVDSVGYYTETTDIHFRLWGLRGL